MKYFTYLIIASLFFIGCNGTQDTNSVTSTKSGTSTPVGDSSPRDNNIDGNATTSNSSYTTSEQRNTTDTNSNGKQAATDSHLENDNIRIEVINTPSDSATPQTTMNIKPGVKREFQNGPTDEEVKKFEEMGQNKLEQRVKAEKSHRPLAK